MRKDIYIITNDLNNKVYIGQAKNTLIRWSGHKSAAKCHGGFIVIDKAMAKLGIEHFKCEIIEKQIENYNERERYWISHYNCQSPNGYNVAEGGEGAQVGVKNHSALIKDQNIVDAIIKDLEKGEESFPILANKYDLSIKIISSINRGTTYTNNKIKYPIRKRAADLIDEIDIENLWDDLIYTKKSRASLAKKYNTSIYIIDKINNGEKCYNETFQYPLRKGQLTSIEVDKIIKMLKETKISLRQIAKLNNTSYTTVAHINSGKYHHKDDLIYPIRTS